MTISMRSEIEKVKLSLEKRSAKLFHACQLQDFRSYVELGGIPSRNKLANSKLDYTEFDTDKIDQAHDLWDKVFGNFSDFGSSFAKDTSNSFPNPYGPIQIVLNPSALDDMDDLAISLRSAGASDFDRAEECLTTAAQFNDIYVNSEPAGHYSDRFISFKDSLNSRFGRTNCTSPEFNCSIADEVISFDHCAYIIVDRCVYKGGQLIDEVSKVSPRKAILRDYQGKRADLIDELSRLTAEHDCTYRFVMSTSHASSDLKNLVGNMNEFHFNRFARYLGFGTTRV